MSIATIGIGREFLVKRIALAREAGKRLADLGFTEGARGAVIRKSLFGGPLHVRIGEYEVVMRRSEAEGVEVRAASEIS
jgi:ferrous iron transport protein A